MVCFYWTENMQTLVCIIYEVLLWQLWIAYSNEKQKLGFHGLYVRKTKQTLKLKFECAVENTRCWRLIYYLVDIFSPLETSQIRGRRLDTIITLVQVHALPRICLPFARRRFIGFVVTLLAKTLRALRYIYFSRILTFLGWPLLWRPFLRSFMASVAFFRW